MEIFWRTSIVAFLLGAFAAFPGFANTVIPAPLKTDFANACLQAYLKSSPSAQEMGNQLCQCTAREASLQGVRADKLKLETAKIRQNPKYKIQDKALLNAVHICFIDIYSQEVRKNIQAENAVSKTSLKKARKPKKPVPSPSPRPPLKK